MELLPPSLPRLPTPRECPPNRPVPILWPGVVRRRPIPGRFHPLPMFRCRFRPPPHCPNGHPLGRSPPAFPPLAPGPRPPPFPCGLGRPSAGGGRRGSRLYGPFPVRLLGFLLPLPVRASFLPLRPPPASPASLRETLPRAAIRRPRPKPHGTAAKTGRPFHQTNTSVPVATSRRSAPPPPESTPTPPCGATFPNTFVPPAWSDATRATPPPRP